MNIAVVLPRLVVDTSEIADLWGQATVNGYRSIRKTGWDENSTTLAVQAVIELDYEFDTIFLAGSLDLAVFCEAVNVNIDSVKKYTVNSSSSFDAFETMMSTPNSIFVAVDCLRSEDPRADAILSAGAVAISREGTTIRQRRNIHGSSELVSIISEGLIQDSTDSNRIRSQKSMLHKTLPNIMSALRLRNLRRIEETVISNSQKIFGYAGIVTPFIEMAYMIQSGVSECNITTSDIISTRSLELNIKSSNVKTHTTSQSIKYSQLLQRNQLTNDPGNIPQGAYISTPVYNNNSGARYRLQARQCTNCKSVEFPPRRLCKQCGGQTKDGPALSRTGIVYAYTSILKGAAPTEFDYQQLVEGIYCVAIIEFPEGPKVITQLSDVEISDLNIGDKVRMVFRKIYTQSNQPRYGYKFVMMQ